MTDADFLAAVEAPTYPGEAFRHRAHVRLAWLCLCEHGFESGLERVRGLIQGYATALGATGKYHETLTRAWAELVQVGLDAAPGLTVPGRRAPSCTWPAFRGPGSGPCS